MTTPKDAFLRGDFNRGFSLIGFHEGLRRAGLCLLTPHIPHKIFLTIERIACKTHEGGYAALDISLDWIKQEFTVEVSPS